MRKYLMINGSNMNLMGMREPCYGTVTMAGTVLHRARAMAPPMLPVPINPKV